MKRKLLIFLFAFNLAKCQNMSDDFDFSIFNNTPLSALANAVKKEDTTEIKRQIIDLKVNINYQEKKFGSSMLSLALQNNKNLSTKTLLKLNANPNLKSPINGSSPFLEVCNYPKEIINVNEIVLLLIKYRANVNDKQIQTYSNPNGSKYQYKQTALEMACQFGSDTLVQILLKNGAKLDMYPVNGDSSLAFTALSNSDLGVLKYLLFNKIIQIPEYCVIRDKQKLTLIDLLEQRATSGNKNQEIIKNQILEFLQKERDKIKF